MVIMVSYLPECVICLTASCFTTNGFAILALVCLGITLTSAFVPGYNTRVVSVAPSYTAVMSAYAQGWVQIASVIAPPIVGYITPESSTTTEWGLIFLTIAGTCVVTGLFFQFFGSAEVQHWATTPRTSFLAIRAKQNVMKRTPHVSIMEENGSVHVPGVDDTAVDGVGLLPDDKEDDL
uniref:MFS domain-containing protein n=1 Tax=Panagrellus redivivus TaxID=6233 RepID=A0A7E4VJR4_PANRE